MHQKLITLTGACHNTRRGSPSSLVNWISRNRSRRCAELPVGNREIGRASSLQLARPWLYFVAHGRYQDLYVRHRARPLLLKSRLGMLGACGSVSPNPRCPLISLCQPLVGSTDQFMPPSGAGANVFGIYMHKIP